MVNQFTQWTRPVLSSLKDNDIAEDDMQFMYLKNLHEAYKIYDLTLEFSLKSRN